MYSLKKYFFANLLKRFTLFKIVLERVGVRWVGVRGLITTQIQYNIPPPPDEYFQTLEM